VCAIPTQGCALGYHIAAFQAVAYYSRHYSVSTIARPPYWPQFGQTTCDGFIVPHFGHAWSCLAFSASCDRRMPVREFDCLRLGTPMGTPAKSQFMIVILDPSAYDENGRPVKCGR